MTTGLTNQIISKGDIQYIERSEDCPDMDLVNIIKFCCFSDLISARGSEVDSASERKRKGWIQLQDAEPFGVVHRKHLHT